MFRSYLNIVKKIIINNNTLTDENITMKNINKKLILY